MNVQLLPPKIILTIIDCQVDRWIINLIYLILGPRKCDSFYSFTWRWYWIWNGSSFVVKWIFWALSYSKIFMIASGYSIASTIATIILYWTTLISDTNNGYSAITGYLITIIEINLTNRKWRGVWGGLGKLFRITPFQYKDRRKKVSPWSWN